MDNAADILAGTTGVAAPDIPPNPDALQPQSALPDQSVLPAQGGAPADPRTLSPGPVSQDPNTPSYTPVIPSETMPRNPDVERTYHESKWRQILSRVGTILGGADTTHTLTYPDGTVHQIAMPSSNTEKWARVAMTALGGAAAGLANSQGPGGLAKAGAAGVQYGLNVPKQEQENLDAQATAAQKQVLFNANHAKMDQDYVRNAEAMRQNKITFAQGQADRYNTIQKGIEDSPGSESLGDFAGVEDLPSFSAKYPQAMQGHVTDPNHYLFFSPIINPKTGEQTGSHVTYMSKPLGEQAMKSPPPYPEDYYDSKSQSIQTRMVQPLQGISVNNYASAVKAQQIANSNLALNVAEKLKPPAPTLAKLAVTATSDPDPAKRAEARKSIDLMKEKTGTGTGGAGAGSGEGFSPQASNQQHAQMMVDGLEAPSQVSKRAKDYNQIIPLAQAYSWQKYGEPFDAEISESRYAARKDVLKEFAGGKPADQIQSFQAFTNHAQNLMDDVASFRTGNVKLINTAMNALKKQSDPSIGPLIAHISALRREYQNFLSNNLALKGDEIREGKEIMDENSTPAQIESAAKAFMETAIGRVSALDQRAKRFNVPVGELLTPANRQTITNMGLGDSAAQLIPPAQQQQHMFSSGVGGGTAPPPAAGGAAGAKQVPTGKFPVRVKGEIVGYGDDAKGTNYHAF